MANMARRNFALIGCGKIGSRHAEIITSIGKLLAVCDLQQERALAFADRYSARSYFDLSSMLLQENEIDICVICTPNGLHALHSIACLEKGFHVLCEKPMAIDVEDCLNMIKAAEKSGRTLSIVKQNRFNPPVAALKSAIDDGRLGRILNVQLNCFWNRNANYYSDGWRGTLKLDGGTLYTQFSHFIDLLPWLVGEVKEVNARFENFLHRGIIEFEDTGAVVLKFEGGAIGTINYTVNSHRKNMEGSITLFGEKGTIKVGGAYLNLLEYQDVDHFEIQCEPSSGIANQYGHYEGSMSNHEAVYENFLGALEKGDALMSDMYEGLRTVSLIEKIYQHRK